MLWMSQPLPRFATAFGIGIACIESLGWVGSQSVESALVAVALAAMALVRNKASPMVLGFSAALMVCAVHARADARWHPLVWEVAEERVEAEIEGTVAGSVRVIDDRWSVRLRIHTLDDAPGEASVVLRGRGAPPRRGAKIRTFVTLERPAPDDFVVDRGRRRRAERAGAGLVARSLEPVEELEAPSVVELPVRVLDARRRALQKKLLTVLGAERGGIAVALLTGEKAWVDRRVMQAYNDTGCAHVLAISGLHFGIVAAVIWWVTLLVVRRFRALRVRWGERRVAAAAVLFGLTVFMLFVGAPVSAVRAWIGASMLIASLLTLRPFCTFHALSSAFVLILAHEPSAIQDLGFQLSFAATFAILVFLDRKPAFLEAPAFGEESRTSRWRRAFLLSSGISTAATALTTPIILAHMGYVATSAFWTNLIVIPAVSTVVFPGLLLGVALEAVGIPWVGTNLMVFTMEVMLAMGTGLAEVVKWPLQVWVPGVPPVWMIAVLTVLIAVLIARPVRRLALGSMVGMVAILVGISAVHERPSVAEIHMIPVGQGDSILVRLPRGDLLIDVAGTASDWDPGRAIVAPYLRRIGVSRLEAVVITHDDLDHSGGVDAVEEILDVGRVVDGGDVPLAWTDGPWQVRMAQPPECTSSNDMSIVSLLVYRGKRRALLTGDIEACGESWLGGFDASAPVVQAPHHGSKSSSSPAFIRLSSGRIVLVSAGRHSRFDHPSEEVIQRWLMWGARIVSTARHGVGVLQFHPDSIQVRTRRPMWAAHWRAGDPR